MISNNKLLKVVFGTMLVLTLLFCGAAIHDSIYNVELIGKNGTSGISWLWAPTTLFLVLSIMIAWIIYAKKKE